MNARMDTIIDILGTDILAVIYDKLTVLYRVQFKRTCRKIYKISTKSADLYDIIQQTTGEVITEVIKQHGLFGEEFLLNCLFGRNIDAVDILFKRDAMPRGDIITLLEHYELFIIYILDKICAHDRLLDTSYRDPFNPLYPGYLGMTQRTRYAVRKTLPTNYSWICVTLLSISFTGRKSLYEDDKFIVHDMHDINRYLAECSRKKT